MDTSSRSLDDPFNPKAPSDRSLSPVRVVVEAVEPPFGLPQEPNHCPQVLRSLGVCYIVVIIIIIIIIIVIIDPVQETMKEGQPQDNNRSREPVRIGHI